MENEEQNIDEIQSNGVLPCVSISFIHNLIAKYEDKIKCAENLKRKGIGFCSTVPSQKDIERLDVRIYERKTFIEDLRSLLDEC